MWLVIGLLLGIGLLAFVLWLRAGNIAVAWYEWLLGVAGFLLLIFTLQNYFGSRAEYEPVAPGMFLLVFGIPALVLILLAVFLVWFRQSRMKKGKAAPEAVKA